MRIERIYKQIHKFINTDIFFDYDCEKDFLTIIYTINNHTYDIVFANIKAIKTEEQLDFLIDVVNTNIQYHIDEQENKQQ